MYFCEQILSMYLWKNYTKKNYKKKNPPSNNYIHIHFLNHLPLEIIIKIKL